MVSMGDLRERQMVDDMGGLMDQLLASEEAQKSLEEQNRVLMERLREFEFLQTSGANV